MSKPKRGRPGIGNEAGFKKFQQIIEAREDVELAVDLQGWLQVVKNRDSAAPAICKRCRGPVRSSISNFRQGSKRCNCSKISNQHVAGWKGVAGFARFQRLVSIGHVENVRITTDVDGWLKTVKGNRSTVPLECTICDAPVNSSLMNFLHHKSKGCCCHHKTERKLRRWLVEEYPDENITREVSFVSCVASIRLRFDFGFDGRKILIELDGIQHFEETPHFSTSRPLAGRQHLDLVKERWAKSKGFTLIRVPQWNVWENSVDWKAFLRVEIAKALAEPVGKVVTPGWAKVYKEGAYAELRKGV